MPTDHRAKLAAIKRFDQLIAYLRDEMDWPIENGSSFEDLTFEYLPDELGIDAKTAAKIQEIKRLRPLSPKQPWGIFFVKFEPKRLPVVALRRILGQVALKKRASANSAERAAWAADDLLFVSNYGEGDERQICFAHFARAQDGHDLPTLKVLGWDNSDTALHLDAVARELTEHLAWPDDDANAEAWRARWSAAFTLGHREVVTTSKELAVRLAELARAVRDRIKTALAIETDKGPLTRLMKAFQTALVQDLDADGFADMYAQTIAYGLLSSRIADPSKKTADDFAAHMRTNPFLRELMETFLKVGGRKGKVGGQGKNDGIDFDELGVSEVVELLDAANMEAVVRDFGDRNPQEDPVIHFYELFLKEYDAKKRMSRGVFFTPRPVVSYIVRSVDDLLRTEFGLADGLADTTTWGEMAKRHKDLKIPEGVSPEQDFVQILDPATGTGTFLVEVIDLIHKTLVAKWKARGHSEKKIDALWNEYVPKHLLTRLHGYELLMAPYAIAHLKIGLKLYETGYRFDSDERARVYLTNALEPAGTRQLVLGFLPALAHEAEAVCGIKEKQLFTIVIGNPPYAGHSLNNQIAWIVDKVYDYKRGHPALQKPGQAKWLQDDYVKFLRLAECQLGASQCGVLGFITNHSYLDNPTFVGMRRSLLASFSSIRVVNLNGNSSERLVAPDGSRDENVFDIQQGVSITLGLRRSSETQSVFYRDIFGERQSKYAWLTGCSGNTGEFEAVTPEAPHYSLRPTDGTARPEFEAGESIPQLLNQLGDPAAGIVTTHDQFAISWTAEEAKEKVARLLRTDSEEAARRLFRLCSQAQWSYERAKVELSDGSWVKDLRKVLYHPFDYRWTVFNRNVAVHRRERVMAHMLDGRNVGLITVRNVPPGAKAPYAFVTRHIIVNGAIRPAGSPSIDSLFPLYIRQTDAKGIPGLAQASATNLDPRVVRSIVARLNLRLVNDGVGDLETTTGPDDILSYVYACLYSKVYRQRYGAFLEAEFARIQFASSLDVYRELVRRGSELVALHLLEAPKVDRTVTEYLGLSCPEVEKVSWSKDTVWLNRAQTAGFKGVREEVWNFRIGGYQVCEKWLKDRKGRTLSKDDIAHYQKIIVALSETIRLMREIDEVIEQHGGWPNAFRSNG